MEVYDQEKRTARENLCRFLSACYYQPGPEFAEEKVFDSMLDAAARIHPDLAAHARRLGAAFSAEGYESLLLDYTRLFLGPSHIIAKPYGSVWLEGEQSLMQRSSMAVEALYQEGGFGMDADFRELPDHIAVELEFLYLLIYRENEARRNDDPDALMAMTELRKRFLDKHLGSWVGPFTATVKAGAQSGFYRELAALTGRFVQIEARGDGAR
jgi:TorA maturation chaperone TorD